MESPTGLSPRGTLRGMADFYMKQGDRAPAIASTLVDENGDPVDLTGAAVRWAMRPLEDAAAVVDAAATIAEPPTSGKVLWWPDPMDTPGIYLGEWRVTYGDGRTQTFPSERQLVLEVTADVEGAPDISGADLAWIREWIGSQPDDNAVAVRLGQVDGKRSLAALSFLRQRRADLLTDPLSYSIRGDITVNAQGNLNALDGIILQLEAVAVADGDMDAAAPDSFVLERADTWGRGWSTSRIPS